MRIKRFLSMILAMGLICSNILARPIYSITDLPTYWSKGAIEKAVENNILTAENGLIRPKDSLTRAEMAEGITNVFGATKKANLSEYKDVSQNEWYYEAMQKAVEMGIISGYGNGLIKPEKNITRQEMFAVIFNALELEEGNTYLLNKFNDSNLISGWAKGIVARMVQNNYVAGTTEGNLRPVRGITREEFAQVMKNIFGEYYNEEGTYTNAPEGNIVISTTNVVLKDTTVTGDLIIADGVGSGEVTLDNVIVNGRTLIRGGGENSVKLINNTTLNGKVIVNNNIGKVRIYNSKSTINNIDIKTPVILEGNFKNVNVNKSVDVETKGNIEKIVVNQKSDIIVSSGKVEQISVNSEAKQTTVSGKGKVTQVNVNANDVTVTVEKAKVEAGKNVTGVLAGKVKVESGKIVTVKSSSSGGGGGGGGSSSGGGGSSSSKITWTLSYNANGGNNAPTSQSHTKTSSEAQYTFTVSSLAPIRNNYNFKGWSTNSSATNVSYNPGDKITVSSNVTLYAVWEEIIVIPDTYTIKLKYDANGGSNCPTEQSYTGTEKSHEFVISSETPIKEGYTFIGWAETKDATDKKYEKEGKLIIDKDITLFAVWKCDICSEINCTKIHENAEEGNSYPTFAPQDTWYKSDIYKSHIEKIVFAKELNTTETIVDTWNADEENLGEIVCYIVGEDVYTLYVIGQDCERINTNEDASNMFGEFGSLLQNSGGIISIENIGMLNTSKTKNMNGMFNCCFSLKELDLSNFDTRNVTDMSSMFINCRSLEKLTLKSFNTGNVTNMANMFGACSELRSIDLSNFNTSNVTDMNNMFAGCTSLPNLDLSKLKTDKVENMSCMFWQCEKLDSIDFTNWNTSSVTDMSGMFSGCIDLVEIDLSEFNTSNVINMSDMFGECIELESINLDGFKTDKVENMSFMFATCMDIIELDLSNFNTSNVSEMDCMFEGTRLRKITLGSDFSFKGTESYLPKPYTGRQYWYDQNGNNLTPAEVAGKHDSLMIYYADLVQNAGVETLGIITENATLISNDYEKYLKIKVLDQNGEESVYTIYSEENNDITDAISYNDINEDTLKIDTVIKFISDSYRGILIDDVRIIIGNETDIGLGEVENLKIEIPESIYIDVDNMAINDYSFTENTILINPYEKEIIKNFNVIVSPDDDSEFVITVDETNVYLFTSGDEIIYIVAWIDEDNYGGNITQYGIVTSFGNFSTVTILQDGKENKYDCNNSFEADVNVGDFISFVANEGEIVEYAKEFIKYDIINYIRGIEDGIIDITEYTNLSDAIFIEELVITSVDIDGEQPTLKFEDNKTVKLSEDYIIYDLYEKAEDDKISIGDYVLIADYDDKDNTYNIVINLFGDTKLAKQDKWYNSDIDKEEITSIEISTNKEVLNGKNVRDSWKADMSLKGEIGCYIVEDKLYIIGDSKIKLSEDASRTFADFINVVEIKGLETLDTSIVKNMSEMFISCDKLEDADLAQWHTSNVENMSAMFYGCDNLKNVDVSKFEMGNVKNINSMFFECKLLNKIDVSTWDTSKILYMSSVFEGCSSLKELDVSDWETKNVRSMASMFWRCRSLESLDLSSWDVYLVEDMRRMFQECSSLKSIKEPIWEMSFVSNTSYMFWGCSSLIELDVSKMDTNFVDNMKQMFYGCSSLTTLDVSNFKMERVDNIQEMFAGCSALTYLDLSKWDTTQVTNMTNIFNGITNLTSITLGKNFVFGDETSYIPSPSLEGSDGKWYDENGVGRTVAEVVARHSGDNRMEATYYAINPKLAVTNVVMQEGNENLVNNSIEYIEEVGEIIEE